jgi:hypothetical protein
VYPYYRANERKIRNILHDLPVMPELAAGPRDSQDHLCRMWATFLAP